MDSQTTTLNKRKTTPESSRKTPGSISRSLAVFLTVLLPSKTRISGFKTQFLEPKKQFATKVGLTFYLYVSNLVGSGCVTYRRPESIR